MTDPLAALKERFRVRSVADRAEIERLLQADPGGPDLRRLVHNLAGAAGTFGYGPLSEAAIAVDDQLASGQPMTPESVRGLMARLDELDRPSG